VSTYELKKIPAIFLIPALLCILPQQSRAVETIPREIYLEYALASADWAWEHYDELIQRWKLSFDPENDFGYRAPGGLLEMAVIYSFLFEKDGLEEYARRAEAILLSYGDFRTMYPEYAREKKQSDEG